MANKFWKFAKAEAGNELILDGVIASESWWEDDVTPKMFREELAKYSGALTVRINSPGGDVSAGVAIYNYLNEHEGEVTVKVDGIAASIASLIAMAGDKIVMLPGSMMMVHLPWTFAAGNSDDMAQVVEMLEKTGESMIPIYSARTGLSEERVEELLKAETWMTAEDAVELGFADEAIEAKTTVSDSIKNALSFASTVQSAVMQPVMSLQARKAEATNDADEPETTVENDTEEQTPVEAEVEETEVEETEEPETTEVTDPVEEETNEPVEEKETVMTEQEKAAAKQVIEPKAQADPADVKQQTIAKDYLKSKASVEDFANVLMKNAGKSPEEVKAAWEKQCIKAGLTDPDYFLPPEPVITRISDAVKTSGIYSLLNSTGLDVFKAVWDDTDPNTDTSRAGQHTKGDEKAEQILDFDKRVLRPRYIYKYLVLDKETIREQRSTGALITFVLNELPTRIIREIERAVVIGDGRGGGDDRKVTSFIAVKADVAANNAFASEYTPGSSESIYETLIRARDQVEAEGDMYIVSKKGYLTELLLETNANGGYQFAPGTDVARALGFSGSFEPTWFNDTTDPDYDAYIIVFNAYRTVGDDSIESFTNFALKTNENEFLQEIYKGGGLTEVKAAVGISSVASS